LRDNLTQAKAAYWARENEQTRQRLAAYLVRIEPRPDQQCGTLLG
jgi:hypothetical protein